MIGDAAQLDAEHVKLVAKPAEAASPSAIQNSTRKRHRQRPGERPPRMISDRQASPTVPAKSGV